MSDTGVCKDKMPRRCGETGGENCHCPLLEHRDGISRCGYDLQEVKVSHACHHGLWKRGPILFTDKEVSDPGVELRRSKILAADGEGERG